MNRLTEPGSGGIDGYSRPDEDFLEEFHQVQRLPNDNEYAAIAGFVRWDTDDVECWCKSLSLTPLVRFS